MSDLRFSTARQPRIIFGAGTLANLPEELSLFGKRILIVTGAGSFRQSENWPTLIERLEALKINWQSVAIESEPSPDQIDDIVADHRSDAIEVVVGIGGGSALDAAKAVAGLLVPGNSVMDHLEGVGPELPYRGPALPFVAVPTTAGTGSEVTKNAVLSRSGPDGFKKSFRDDALVARLALVDPDLLATCPPRIIAANGMDAFTQLLESYVSIRANPMSEALAWSGMEYFTGGFFNAWLAADGRGNLIDDQVAASRAAIAYASLTSGIVLAQTGLGAVHGLASPLGCLYPISHGLVCGTLLAEATEVNINALREREPRSPALEKYAAVGSLVSGRDITDPGKAQDMLVKVLRQWTEKLDLPPLSAFGVNDARVSQVVAGSRGSSMKTNPIVLTDGEISEIIFRRL